MHNISSDSTAAIHQLEVAGRELANNPGKAAEIFREVLKREPGNLVAHNALELLRDRDSYGRWMHINCVIDPRDDIFRFFADYPNAGNAVREYLSDGWRTLSELLILLERLDKPLTRMNRVLEFAAGFGRFTRHLSRAIPGHVVCTDVQPGSIEFLREQFGVDAFHSHFDPANIAYPEQYDLVFVLSMFTHLPIAHWSEWLKNLHRALKPGGLLVFSVHNENAALEAGVKFDGRGTHFIGSSESPSLAADAYGTTFTTREFVRLEVARTLGDRLLLHEPLVFWGGQDAVVVSA